MSPTRGMSGRWHLQPVDQNGIAPEEKLKLLQRLDRFRVWHTTRDRRLCLGCGKIISGAQIRLGRGLWGPGAAAPALSDRKLHGRTDGLGQAGPRLVLNSERISRSKYSLHPSASLRVWRWNKRFPGKTNRSAPPDNFPSGSEPNRFPPVRALPQSDGR